MFLGRSFTINSDKEQIIDLLMSTFEDIVRTNRDLQKHRSELAAAKLEIEDYAQSLERRLEERTRELAEQKRLARPGPGHGACWQLAYSATVSGNFREWSRRRCSQTAGVDHGFEPSLPAIMSMVHEEDRQNVDEMVGEAIKSHQSYRVEYRIVRPNGHVRFCSAEGFWERGADGQVTNLIGYCQDITERKLAEIVAQESSARYRHIVESMASGLIVLNEGRFSFLNNAACRIFGVKTPEDLLGTLFADAIAGPRRHEIAAGLSEIAATEAGPIFSEEKFLRRDGKEVDVEISKAALTYAGVPATQIVIKDITESKALARQLHQSQKMEVVGQLTGGIAHISSTFSTVVISNLDLDTCRCRW